MDIPFGLVPRGSRLVMQHQAQPRAAYRMGLGSRGPLCLNPTPDGLVSHTVGL